MTFIVVCIKSLVQHQTNINTELQTTLTNIYPHLRITTTSHTKHVDTNLGLQGRIFIQNYQQGTAEGEEEEGFGDCELVHVSSLEDIYRAQQDGWK